MKKKLTIAIAALVAGASYSTSSYALETELPENELRIQLADSANFTDIDLGYADKQRQAELIMKDLRSVFQKAANKYLPDGYTLEVRINDIDLAGDRSMMTSQFGEYRVLRDTYPPRIVFDYAVYDAQERLVTSGTANKTDLNYSLSIRGPSQLSDDKAPYIAELVRGWASTELRRAVKQ